jgi:methionyl aminopeptidase
LQIPEQYVSAGKITREVRDWVKKSFKPGMGYVGMCEAVEREVIAKGGGLPFPCAVGVNHVTAHYAPPRDDRSVFQESDVLKVDFGVHLDGYLTDTAVTLTFNPEYEPMLDATEKALAAAIQTARVDARAGEIGKSISNQASRFGFKVIENLTGHTVDRYIVHAGRSIPNLYMPNIPTLRKGDVFAVEPFLTTKKAAGYVVDGPSETIFSVVARKVTGVKELDEFVTRIWNERKTLPFTPRWYEADYPAEKISKILGELVHRKLVRGYATLVEASGSPVAQFEHTMALDDSGLTVLT